MSTKTINSVVRYIFLEKSLSAQTFSTTITNLTLSLLGFISGFLLARFLGPSGRGELAAIQMYPTLLSVVGVIGITDALVYYSAKDPDNSGHWLMSGMALTVMSGFIFICIGYIAMPLILGAQSPSTISAARVYLLIIAVNATIGLLSHSVRGLGKIQSWNMMRILPSVMWIAVIISVWLIGKITPEMIAVSFLVGNAILAIPLIWIANRIVARPLRVEVKRWSPLLKYGLPSVLAFLPTTLNLRLDQMLMAGLLATEQLGLYVVAVSWSNVLILVAISGIGGVLIPHVAAKDRDWNQRVLLVARAVRFAIFLLPPFVVGAALITPTVFPFIFGAAFAPAVPTSIVLIFAAAIAGLNGVMEAGINGLGFPIDVMYAELMGLIFTVVFLLLLLKPLGIIGAAIASLISYSIVTTFLVSRLIYRTDLKASDFTLPRALEVKSQILRFINMFFEV